MANRSTTACNSRLPHPVDTSTPPNRGLCQLPHHEVPISLALRALVPGRLEGALDVSTYCRPRNQMHGCLATVHVVGSSYVPPDLSHVQSHSRHFVSNAPSNRPEYQHPGGKASGESRTRNLLITNQLLCQLSYAGPCYITCLTSDGGEYTELPCRPVPTMETEGLEPSTSALQTRCSAN